MLNPSVNNEYFELFRHICINQSISNIQVNKYLDIYSLHSCIFQTCVKDGDYNHEAA